MKACVLGLDCLEPSLVERWLADLPTLARLQARGRHGRMRSCTPPITVPAWSCMMTGRDPGELGIYGFRNRTGYDYAALGLATSEGVKFARVWEVLAGQGRRSVVVGVPGTYPIKPLAEVTMIADFMTPDHASHWCHPPTLREDVRGWLGGEDYLFDVPDFRTADKARILADVREMTRRRFVVARALWRREQPDFFMLVEMGSDRLHHALWQTIDPQHRRYEPDHPLAQAIHDYYVELDREIGRFLESVDLQDTTVLLVSDHGATRLDGAICINEWLRREGLLILQQDPPRAGAALAECAVDWQRTVAWAEGGYYARIFLNVAGREPQGLVPPDAYERTRGDLAHRLTAIPDDRGRALATAVHRPEGLYRAVEGIAPDLIVLFGDLRWRAAGTLGWPGIHLLENDQGPDEANHARDGFFIWTTPDGAPAAVPETIDILEIAPHLLELLAGPVPRDLAGPGRGDGYSAAERTAVEKRLEALGYLG